MIFLFYHLHQFAAASGAGDDDETRWFDPKMLAERFEYCAVCFAVNGRLVHGDAKMPGRKLRYPFPLGPRLCVNGNLHMTKRFI